MDSASPLAALKDIHLSPPPGFWPLAPGWYLLMLLIVVLTIAIIKKLHKLQVMRQPKKEALTLLMHVRTDYENTGNSQQACAKTAELLKRVALVYYPRMDVASLHGQTWIDFLNRTAKNINFNNEAFMLLEVPFKPPQKLNVKPLLKKAERWIKQRRIHA